LPAWAWRFARIAVRLGIRIIARLNLEPDPRSSFDLFDADAVGQKAGGVVRQRPLPTLSGGSERPLGEALTPSN
jgi:hypothetical protein